MTFRALIPPLAILATLITALGLFLTAAAIDTPMMTRVGPSSSPTTPDDQPSSRSRAIADGQQAGPTSMSLLRTEPVALPGTSLMVGLARLIYPPDAAASSPRLPGPFILASQSGTLDVGLDGLAQYIASDRESVVVAERLSLGAAGGLVLATGTAFEVANHDVSPAVVLAAGVFPTSVVKPVGSVRAEVVRWPEELSPGARVQPLAGGWVVGMWPDAASLDLTRKLVKPGESLELNAPGAALLSVEAGVLTATAQQGLAWLQPADGPDARIDSRSATTLLPGDGAMLQSGARATLRNEGSCPVLVLVLTMNPVEGASDQPAAA